MHRFKASKYKNSVVKGSKKEECFTDISVEVPLCFGNGLAVGTRFIASNISSAGSGKIGIFGVNHPGRMGQNPTLSAHGDSVIDLEWSPFHHNILLSASQDTTVKLWKLPSNGLSESAPINPVATFTGFKKRPELLRHHTIADNTFAVADESGISIWNIDKGISMCGWDTIACTTKSRSKQLRALDQRNLSSCLQTLEFGSSTGFLPPVFSGFTFSEDEEIESEREEVMEMGYKRTDTESEHSSCETRVAVQPFNQSKLNDLVRDLDLSKQEAQLLASRLKEKQVLD
ncbi:coronin-1C-like [Clavelina lepadiformis]|uniref:coronin-1C-like n=1 Tax=Clavelina lepadiformis TaxID=159417 RepID=UPI0040414EBB